MEAHRSRIKAVLNGSENSALSAEVPGDSIPACISALGIVAGQTELEGVGGLGGYSAPS